MRRALVGSVMIAAIFAIFPGVVASSPGLAEPHVVDLAPNTPVSIEFVLEERTIEAGSLVVVATSLLLGDSLGLVLDDGGPIGQWSFVREGKLSERLSIADRPHAGLNATVTSDSPARVLVYVDASCACTSRDAAFPGALLAFHGNVSRGDAVVATIRAPSGTSASAEAYDAADLLRPAARSTNASTGEMELRWRASGDGLAYVVVEVEDGLGPISFELARTPADPSSTPSGAIVALVALLIAGLGRKAVIRS